MAKLKEAISAFLTLISCGMLGLCVTSVYMSGCDSIFAETESDKRPQATNVSWFEVSSVYGRKSNYTKLQKKEIWNEYKGRRVKWEGKVSSVDTWVGSLVITLHMGKPATMADVSILMRRSERQKAMKIEKGDTLCFSGNMTNWGELIPISLDDGLIE